MTSLILITGGSRSGKSAFAQQMMENLPGKRLFVATCPHTDAEMDERIRRHVEQRQGRGWQDLEEPVHLRQLFSSLDPGVNVLIDCLTLWVNNMMYSVELSGKEINDEVMCSRAQKLALAAREFSGTVIMVTNEVGLGIVPDNPMARRYRDLVGRCNQVMASLADEVFLVTCGLPLQIKYAE